MYDVAIGTVCFISKKSCILSKRLMVDEKDAEIALAKRRLIESILVEATAWLLRTRALCCSNGDNAWILREGNLSALHCLYSVRRTPYSAYIEEINTR